MKDGAKRHKEYKIKSSITVAVMSQKSNFRCNFVACCVLLMSLMAQTHTNKHQSKHNVPTAYKWKLLATQMKHIKH